MSSPPSIRTAESFLGSKDRVRKTLIEGVLNYLIESPLRVLNFLIVSTYQTGNAAALEQLGLRYEELRTLDDPLEITSRIVAAACGPNESTIEDIEQRYVAAQVVEWVFAAGPTAMPTPEEIVRKTISLIILETLETETGEMLRNGQRPAWASEIAENEMREAAEAIAQRAPLSVDGVSDAEFAAAIENGIEALRQILGDEP
jgi:uncharacterized protein YciI